MKIKSTRRWLVTTVVAVTIVLLGTNSGHATDPDALWKLVHDKCVPDQYQNDDPAPCAFVDQREGDAKGYAILKDRVATTTQYLLIRTIPVLALEALPPTRLPSRPTCRGAGPLQVLKTQGFVGYSQQAGPVRPVYNSDQPITALKGTGIRNPRSPDPGELCCRACHTVGSEGIGAPKRTPRFSPLSSAWPPIPRSPGRIRFWGMGVCAAARWPYSQCRARDAGCRASGRHPPS
jgi:CDP-diacylglycerol pyrophosphatase